MGKMETTFKFGAESSEPNDLAASSSRTRPALADQALGGASIGRLYGFDLERRPLVAELAHTPAQISVARSAVTLTDAHIGASVVVVFEGRDPCKPIVLGVLQEVRTGYRAVDVPPAERSTDHPADRVVVEAQREIVLRCGDSSITLTRAGKVIIKGNYLVSRSTGYNKIKGAAIDIN